MDFKLSCNELRTTICSCALFRKRSLFRMSSFRAACDKLLHNSKPAKKTDLLTEREYQQIASTSHDEFLAENYSCSQLNKLCTAEKEHLILHYNHLEKRVERNQRKIRKIYSTKPAIKKKDPVQTDVSAPIRPIVDEQERDIIATTEEVVTITEPEVNVETPVPEPLELEHDTENTALANIELSQVMPPKEFLKTEPSPPILMAMDPSAVDLDFGPVGDAGSFLGTSEPMPISDPSVKEQVLKEFPSLRRITVPKRFEDFEIDDAVQYRLPVPLAGRLTTSTPIPSVRTSMLRQRVPIETSQLEATDVSSIPTGTPLTVPLPVPSQRSQAISDRTNEVHHREENEGTAPENLQIPVQQMEVDTEIPPVVTEPERPEPASNLPALSSDSSTNMPPPPNKRVPKSCRKVRMFGDTIEDKIPLRKNYDFGIPDDFEKLDAGRKIILDLLARRRVPDIRDRPVENVREPVLRDVSETVRPELASIQEPSVTQNNVVSSLEQPSLEDRDRLQVIDRTVPSMVEEITVHPKEPVVPADFVPPEVGLVNTAVDPGLGLDSQSIFINSTQQDRLQTSDSILPQAVCSSKESQVPQLPIPTENVQDNLPENSTITKDARQNQLRLCLKNKEKMVPMLKLYFAIQHEISCTRRNSVLFQRILLLVGAAGSKLASCRVFRNLLELNGWGLLEIDRDDRAQIRCVSLRGSPSGATRRGQF
ncbi:uncharacterized protein LOC129731723 isoform X2 [Wyeomyia smithii]|uniref:uncharacterized protein LOC129731723 isoform X2 n=1 Tax=Wyeomyia smithii TaxID=174621 RepID=UPI002467AFD7|nr:uncharacterized protein LOC129731723 isoform X2 [Wyeomyia smithii]